MSPESYTNRRRSMDNNDSLTKMKVSKTGVMVNHPFMNRFHKQQVIINKYKYFQVNSGSITNIMENPGLVGRKFDSLKSLEEKIIQQDRQL